MDRIWYGSVSDSVFSKNDGSTTSNRVLTGRITSNGQNYYYGDSFFTDTFTQNELASTIYYKGSRVSLDGNEIGVLKNEYCTRAVLREVLTAGQSKIINTAGDKKVFIATGYGAGGGGGGGTTWNTWWGSAEDSGGAGGGGGGKGLVICNLDSESFTLNVGQGGAGGTANKWGQDGGDSYIIGDRYGDTHARFEGGKGGGPGKDDSSSGNPGGKGGSYWGYPVYSPVRGGSGGANRAAGDSSPVGNSSLLDNQDTNFFKIYQVTATGAYEYATNFAFTTGVGGASLGDDNVGRPGGGGGSVGYGGDGRKDTSTIGQMGGGGGGGSARAGGGNPGNRGGQGGFCIYY